MIRQNLYRENTSKDYALTQIRLNPKKSKLKALKI